MGHAEIPSEWMRCAACGAPLRLREGLGAWVCDVCGSAVVVFGGGGGMSYAGVAGGNRPPDEAVGPEPEYITRQAAVREALDVYHALEVKRAAAEAAEDTGSEVVFAAAAAVAKSMVRRLMELPGAGGEDHA